MRQTHSSSGPSGWEWNSQSPATPHPPRRAPPPPRGGGGGAEAILAVVALLLVVGLGAGVYFFVTRDGGGGIGMFEKSDPEAAEAAEAPKPSSKPKASASAGAVPSIEQVAWTTDAPTTLQDLARTWSIPRDVLDQLNPTFSASQQLDAGTKVVVYASTLGASASIGPPNDGRLVWGVALPEGEAWLLPENRSRAFATTETIVAVLEALHAYSAEFPEAEPVQIGELSARRGGEIYGHQSHQSGLDVDIRLIQDAARDGFDGARNWFLVKTLIDNNDVRAIFLNRSEQTWLREAAEEDVGVELAEEYFELIRHEPGHTIHMHVRFACADEDKRCVGYSLPDTDEEDSGEVGKLPLGPGGKPTGPSKLPGFRPKADPAPAASKKKTKTKAKKKKKKGKKKLSPTP